MRVRGREGSGRERGREGSGSGRGGKGREGKKEEVKKVVRSKEKECLHTWSGGKL